MLDEWCAIGAIVIILVAALSALVWLAKYGCG